LSSETITLGGYVVTILQISQEEYEMRCWVYERDCMSPSSGVGE